MTSTSEISGMENWWHIRNQWDGELVAHQKSVGWRTGGTSKSTITTTIRINYMKDHEMTRDEQMMMTMAMMLMMMVVMLMMMGW
jgi:hypothetical protein